MNIDEAKVKALYDNIKEREGAGVPKEFIEVSLLDKNILTCLNGNEYYNGDLEIDSYLVMTEEERRDSLGRGNNDLRIAVGWVSHVKEYDGGTDFYIYKLSTIRSKRNKKLDEYIHYFPKDDKNVESGLEIGGEKVFLNYKGVKKDER